MLFTYLAGQKLFITLVISTHCKFLLLNQTAPVLCILHRIELTHLAQVPCSVNHVHFNHMKVVCFWCLYLQEADVKGFILLFYGLPVYIYEHLKLLLVENYFLINEKTNNDLFTEL